MGRQVKKTVIKYQIPQQKIVQTNQQESISKVRGEELGQERQRSREKITTIAQQKKKEVTVDVNSRKARLEAMKKARQQKDKQEAQGLKIEQQKQDQNSAKDIKIVIVGHQDRKDNQKFQQQQSHPLNNNLHLERRPQMSDQQQVKIQEKLPQSRDLEKKSQKQSSSQQQDQEGPRVIHRPVFLSKQDRSQLQEPQAQEKLKEQERRKKNLRYTTKLLLQENLRKDQAEDSEEEIDNNDDQDETNLPDDSDDKNEELQYELWKIRELKRIRRDRELRQKHVLEKVEIQRRRQMNNEQILLENRLLGSDSTDHDTETKYMFMQKYYHKGAFYQDSSDPIFQRDYNLPTPMEMQDKSALPEVLQKRKGNFGKRGQSKYTHLTAEDTTDTNPLTRADESLLNSWKKKMAGYKK